MSKCNQCPYNYYDYEGNYTDCSLYDVRNPSLILWNENKCRCRIPLFVLKIMHKRDMKAEDKHWGGRFVRRNYTSKGDRREMKVIG